MPAHKTKIFRIAWINRRRIAYLQIQSPSWHTWSNNNLGSPLRETEAQLLDERVFTMIVSNCNVLRNLEWEDQAMPRSLLFAGSEG